MDISRWSMSQILELPDHLFGRRHPVGCFSILTSTGTGFDISEMGFPEHFVIWEIVVHCTATFAEYNSASFALGDQLPADDAAFGGLEQLVPDIGAPGGVFKEIYVSRTSAFHMRDLKIGVHAHGRRLVMRHRQLLGETFSMQAEFIISSFPRSLPEWFV